MRRKKSWELLKARSFLVVFSKRQLVPKVAHSGHIIVTVPESRLPSLHFCTGLNYKC